MSFLPDGRALVSEQGGRILLIRPGADATASPPVEVGGVPEVHRAGQGGLGDIVAVANADGSTTVHLSWVEASDGGTSGAVVGRADLDLTDPSRPRLDRLSVAWHQRPTVTGDGHFGHRLALSPDHTALFITSGDRQTQEPAQDPEADLGKIIRLDLASGQAEQWSIGHRNPLGIAFAPDGRLWSAEMGPRGGDELNLIVKDGNYGWPEVSNGSHYDGTAIPDHAPGDGFIAPAAWWNPSISPGSLMIPAQDTFPAWRGDAFLGALSGEALVRVDLDRDHATVAQSWPMAARIRVVVEDPRDGTFWLVEDGPDGRLIHATPG